jgi:cystathionine beta-lyase/cystathionine gamma-synthase
MHRNAAGDPEVRDESRIKDSLVRYALGIEDTEDLITDLGSALARI